MERQIFYEKFYSKIPVSTSWITFNNIYNEYNNNIKKQIIIMEWKKHNYETFNSDYENNGIRFNDGKYLRNLTNEELSVYIYTTKLYMKINDCLKNYQKYDMSINFTYLNDKIISINHEHLSMICANICSYIENNKIIYQELYKGIRISSKIGEYMQFNYFVSSTTDKDVAMDFAEGNTLIIIYNAIGAPVKYSKYPNQREILMGNNSNSYRVRVQRDGTKTWREVIAVPMIPNSIVYKIKKNENLTSVAKKFNININILIKVNYIINPDLIYEGENLIIPNKN